MKQKTYFVVDQKSYYATVECVARGLDPMTTKLVVADPDRSANTICLAVSPAMKALGVKNRCRVADIPPNIEYITAKPRMKLYIEGAARIHKVFLRFFAPEDIYTYSIDESFIDTTPYLKMYAMEPRELARIVIQEIRDDVGTVSTCGIGSNMYLAKIALDILAKHDPDYIAQLDEESYRRELWDHEPLTDFWRIGDRTAAKLRNHGMTTMRAIASCNEDILYRMFGIDAELLIDHAWGREPVTISDVKNYKSKSKSLSSGQTLLRDYSAREAEVIAKEMADQLCLDMAAKKLTASSVSLYVGYSYTQGVPGVGGTAAFASPTNVAAVVVPAITNLYRQIVDPAYIVRRVCISCNDVSEDTETLQLSMFEDTTRQLKNKAIQETMLSIRSKYGKNAILKGMSYEEASTARERNNQIGGHHA